MEYSCAACNYTTKKRCNYDKHRKTPKHLKKIADVIDRADVINNSQIAEVPEIKNNVSNPDLTDILNRLNNLEQHNKLLETTLAQVIQENLQIKKQNTELTEEIDDIHDHISNLINRYSSMHIMLKDMFNNKTLLVYNLDTYDKEDITQEYNNNLIKYMQDRAKQRKKENQDKAAAINALVIY